MSINLTILATAVIYYVYQPQIFSMGEGSELIISWEVNLQYPLICMVISTCYYTRHKCGIFYRNTAQIRISLNIIKTEMHFNVYVLESGNPIVHRVIATCS